MTAQFAVVGTEPRLSRLYRANDRTEPARRKGMMDEFKKP
jgi:hypothetical protein